jgi:mannose/fructose/N-acetylgalactosamine-specific phosphotransferase system component IIC
MNHRVRPDGLYMTEEIILITMLGGLASLDKTEAYQTMFSQPLFTGVIIGFLLRDLSIGIKMGILFQLAYLWVLPIGTALFPDPSIGAIVGTFGFIALSRFFPNRADLVLLFIILYILLFSLFAGCSLIKQRKLNQRLIRKADLYAKEGEISKINKLFFSGLLTSFGRGVVLTGLGILGLYILLKPIIGFFSFIPDYYLEGIQIPILGFGIGSMFYFFGKRRNFLWLGLGISLGMVLILI